ncbi:MAG: L-2-amino-thiazoline-4-carboxylic acid hydrolase [Erysipelotrichaceae bacterium]|nr:L-2-amino-thiazoline-4-carboxylic acid hydrolase [Erysipelotrichaceae bacterium]
MNVFNEKTHALVAGLYYRELTALDVLKGKEAFAYGTVLHGMSRGRRMRERVLKDGEKPDFRNYFRYGEWRPSDYSCSLRRPEAQILSFSPDRVISIANCLWHDQFQEMGLGEAERIYCAEIDRAIVRGFSPELEYRTEQTLLDHPCCIQRAVNAGVREGEALDRKEEYVKDFGFHCANSFYAYRQAAQRFFPEEADTVAQKVHDRIEKELGKEAAELLDSYRGYDFDHIGEEDL